MRHWNPDKSDEKLIKELSTNRPQEKQDQIFDTGSRRDSDEHKPRVSDMKAYTRERFGYHMKRGSVNYGTGNFEKGQPNQRVIDSINRHLARYELGDNSGSEDHLSAIFFNVQMLMLNEQRDGLPTNHYYQLYVSSGEYDKDVQRRQEREERESKERMEIMMNEMK